MLRQQDRIHAPGPRRLADGTGNPQAGQHGDLLPSGAAPLLAVGSGVAGACVAVVALVLGEGIGVALVLYFAVSLMLFVCGLALALVAGGKQPRPEPQAPVECDATDTARAAYVRNRRRRILIGFAMLAVLAAFTLTESAVIRQGTVFLSAGLFLRRTWVGRAHKPSRVAAAPDCESHTAMPEAGKTAW